MIENNSQTFIFSTIISVTPTSGCVSFPSKFLLPSTQHSLFFRVDEELMITPCWIVPMMFSLFFWILLLKKYSTFHILHYIWAFPALIYILLYSSYMQYHIKNQWLARLALWKRHWTWKGVSQLSGFNYQLWKSFHRILRSSCADITKNYLISLVIGVVLQGTSFPMCSHKPMWIHSDTGLSWFHSKIIN